MSADPLRIAECGFRIGHSAIRIPQSAFYFLIALWAGGSLHAASAYDDVIAPILRARCAECHGEQKQKAKLALHTWDLLMRGSEGGPVIVAGKPGDSLLLQRLQLPSGDDDHMPPQEKPQPSAQEIALLARWIERGASKTSTVGELNLPPDLAAAAAELPAKLASSAKPEPDPVWELDEAAVRKARAPLATKVAELQRKFPGALTYESRTVATLCFTAVAFGRDFGDRELALLAPLGSELVAMDVSSTAVTDQAAETWKAFPQLRVLRASFTELGDATVAALQPLTKLESLTLHGTKISAASAGVLAKFPALHALRIGETAAALSAPEAAAH